MAAIALPVELNNTDAQIDYLLGDLEMAIALNIYNPYCNSRYLNGNGQWWLDWI